MEPVGLWLGLHLAFHRLVSFAVLGTAPSPTQKADAAHDTGQYARLAVGMIGFRSFLYTAGPASTP